MDHRRHYGASNPISTPRHRWRRSVGAVVAMAVGTMTISGTEAFAGAAARPSAPSIRHVVEIMLENHTFDDLFGNFPGAHGVASNAQLPSPAGGSATVAPLVAPTNEGEVQGGLNNSRAAELTMMNDVDGAFMMNGYTRYPGEGLSAITYFPPSADPNLQYLAHNYELADKNFQPVIAPTSPNVLTALTGTANGLVTNDEPPAGESWQSIFDQLAGAGLRGAMFSGVPASVYAGTVWSALFPRGEGIQPLSSFLTAARRGTLPAFSFVRPGVGYSEEPPEDVSEGDAWLGQLLAAIGGSPDWRSTAVFVTYDEGGGFWDGAAPSVASGYGTRTPMLIISPYARRGVFSSVTTNVAILEFMRTLFHLPVLTPLERRQPNLLSAFDLTQAPLPPPRPPRSPSETVGFYGSSDLADPPAVAPGQTATLSLSLRNSALQQPAASLSLSVRVIAPAGVDAAGIPSTVHLTGGVGTLQVRVPVAGYYRIELSGAGTRGYFTLDAGVTPDTP